MPNRPAVRAASFLPLACLLSPLAATPQSSTPAQLPNEQIIQRIDAAVLARHNAIAGYTVQEHYALFRGSEATPAAAETVQTVYDRATGKQYTPTEQSGSSLLRSAVIDHVLAGEKELNLPANREAAWITSANYELSPEPGISPRNGRPCIVVDLKPRRKSPHLFTGKIWVDSEDFALVRFEGTPVESPSMFAGQTTIARDYIRVDGFSMASHAEAHSHSFLFGDTLLKIDYTNYQIHLGSQTAN